MQAIKVNQAAIEVLAGAPADRARAKKPRIVVIAFGHYQALSSDGQSWYTIRCNSVSRMMTCNCRALKPCLHLASIISIHAFLARQRREAAAEGVTIGSCLGCGTSSEPVVDGKCDFCWILEEAA